MAGYVQKSESKSSYTYAQNFTDHVQITIAHVIKAKVMQALFLLLPGHTLTVTQDRRSPGTT